MRMMLMCTVLFLNGFEDAPAPSPSRDAEEKWAPSPPRDPLLVKIDEQKATIDRLNEELLQTKNEVIQLQSMNAAMYTYIVIAIVLGACACLFMYAVLVMPYRSRPGR